MRHPFSDRDVALRDNKREIKYSTCRMNSVSIQERKIERMLTVNDIIAATGGKVVRMNPDSFTGISIDSRKIQRR